MNWKIIQKKNYPSKGKYYWDWKDYLADEGFNQCVYCTIHENSFGRRNYHVEHYKPKSIECFKHLTHDYSNLFFACCICNCFKGSFWEEPKEDFSNCSFPDPSRVDYSALFQVNDDATISGKNIAGNFIINKLYLNRPQLIIDRKQQFLDIRLKNLIDFFSENKQLIFDKVLSGEKKAKKYLSGFLNGYEKLLRINLRIKETVPYTSADIKKK